MHNSMPFVGQEQPKMDAVALARLPALVVASPDTVLRRARLEQIEAPGIWTRPPAQFVTNLSGAALNHSLLQDHPHERHGTYRQRLSNGVLFGHQHFHGFLHDNLEFDCQDIKGCMFRLEYHTAHHPGRDLPIPQIYRDTPEFRVDMATVPNSAIVHIAGSVYFATPTEPLNWGMWLLHAVPAARDFIANRPASRMLIYVGRDWQRALLNSMGVSDDLIVHQELGVTYRCDELVMRQYSHVDLVPTAADRELFGNVAQELGARPSGAGRRRIFLSRRDVTRRSEGRYRALLNEDSLVEAFAARNFDIVEPEALSFAEQVRLFRDAEMVVGLGGAALFNVVFCLPGTYVVSIESSMAFANGHSMLFGSLGHRFGFVFGRQDPNDDAPVHKRWTVDVGGTMSAIDKIL